VLRHVLYSLVVSDVTTGLRVAGRADSVEESVQLAEMSVIG